MPFKENLPSTPCPALPGGGLVALEGPDALAFAQSQFMGDVAALADGQWQWNGWLTPKGRVIALFAVLRLDAARFWLWLPDAAPGALAEALRRFVLRRKLVVRVHEGHVATAGVPDALPRPAAADRLAGDEATGWVLDLGTPGSPRWLGLLPAGDPRLAPADPAATEAWRDVDIAVGLPRLGPGQAEAWTPQMLSLDRLGAYSLRKGCYPGQEIVARTHYLGQAKRELLRISGEGLAEGQALAADGTPAGTLVCARGDGREALAVTTAGLAGALSVEGRPAGALPFAGDLRRPR